jgi:predicted O-methyltransferase YrrM
MERQPWDAVDRYIEQKLGLSDAKLEAALARNAAEGLPSYDVSAAQGKFLHLIARMIGARRILEIGALGGYSTIWLARALPEDGRIVTLEIDPAHAAVARTNVDEAGVGAKVDIRVSPALDSLAGLVSEGAGSFDLVFIDADKANNAAYLAWSHKLARVGTVIVCDNVVRGGALVNSRSSEASVRGARALFDALSQDPRLTSTALQTVGAKGWDGFTLTIVEAVPRGP